MAIKVLSANIIWKVQDGPSNGQQFYKIIQNVPKGSKIITFGPNCHKNGPELSILSNTIQDYLTQIKLV